MRRETGRLGCALLATSAWLSGCSAAGEGDENTRGSVSFRLSDVPDDARCLEVTFAGARVRTAQVPLTPGVPVEAVLDRLPVGLGHLDARAFALECPAVSTASAPSYVLESPVTVRVKALELTHVSLALIHSGRVGIELDFEPGERAAAEPLELALIGDTPYGADDLAAFPDLVQAINGAGIELVVHLGDIKNGSTRCDTTYFERIYDDLSAFSVPLVYTPGDNEWTDCHRANNGAFDPLERLGVLRSIFYPVPGLTLGAPRTVLSQASLAEHARFIENQLWFDAGVVFSTVHVVGSSNGYAPWFGGATSGTPADDPDRRIAEVEARIAAGLDWIDRSFDLAQAEAAAGVVLFMQADTFQGSTSGFLETIQLLAERARAFQKPVLLVQGDSHRYLVDLPLANGSAEYAIDTPVPNLTRIVVEGETIGEWLKLTIDSTQPSPFTWEPMFVEL